MIAGVAIAAVAATAANMAAHREWSRPVMPAPSVQAGQRDAGEDCRRSDHGCGGRGDQQPGPDQSCSRQHVGSFPGGDVPPPLLRCNDQSRIIRPPRRGRTPAAMMKRRLTKAVLAGGLAGGARRDQVVRRPRRRRLLRRPQVAGPGRSTRGGPPNGQLSANRLALWIPDHSQTRFSGLLARRGAAAYHDVLATQVVSSLSSARAWARSRISSTITDAKAGHIPGEGRMP